MIWGAGLLIASAFPIAAFINAKAPQPS